MRSHGYPATVRVQIHMSSTTHESNSETLTVDCPECHNAFRVDMAAAVEVTDHAPDGIVEATCGMCGEDFVVGFRRREAG